MTAQDGAYRTCREQINNSISFNNRKGKKTPHNMHSYESIRKEQNQADNMHSIYFRHIIMENTGKSGKKERQWTLQGATTHDMDHIA